ncbi:hypothetical protein KO506_02090 [Polaribacter vadi]|uniref:BsuBI/PstI family type II restriction endonuclease n=1 Tax=Polaribacter TaxID=52959 RepID=UPI001C0A5C09|nr:MULTISPECIES: BsuBI/PstI family type II restriction endonuclease [Polaribacter]MBU3010183.1 hypothetical protein [Polaribacter vadi]MDO6739990.1 BsuBI/PstI family type II restriction endonuclease [Polaribacter sp. 1_MG-2023]
MIKKKGEKIDEYFKRLSKEKKYLVPTKLQGISRIDIACVLKKIDLYTLDLTEIVFALLDNNLNSLFSSTKNKFKFSDGATTAHLACYVGIFLRGRNKLDREGRDYWIKPLKELGAIEAYTYDSKSSTFKNGHIKAKSPNSCYRLNSDFRDILKIKSKDELNNKLQNWIKEDSKRTRLEIQLEAFNKEKILQESSGHEFLIQMSINLYAKHFLPDFILVYKDDSDGDRISEEEKKLMESYGISLGIEDAFPDAIFINPKTKELWFIEAVTSDGEVDEHKMSSLNNICAKSNLNFGGATTTYLNWKDFARRQSSNKNLADKSKVWLFEDPQKEFIVNMN